MSSKRRLRRQRERRQCGHKVRFETQTGAVAAKIALQRKQPAEWNLRTYRCPRCGGWHFGHFDPARRQPRPPGV